MIKIMLKPFIKKYLGLFISMVLVSTLSIALLISFSSSVSNLRNDFQKYLDEYENIDGVAKMGITKKSDIAVDDKSGIYALESVDKVEFRLTLDAYLLKDNGRRITARLFTYDDEAPHLFDRYVVESTAPQQNKINVSVLRKFAENNGFKLGDTIKVGYFNIYIPLYINEIVETPEGSQPKANDYVWSDTNDFGFLYIKDQELDRIVTELAKKIEEAINNDPNYKAYYEKVKADYEIDVMEFAEKINEDNYIHAYTNQILVKAKEGYSQSQVMSDVQNYLNVINAKKVTVTEANRLIYILYIENCIRQLKVATVFLPVFFYAITMVVIGLFINQIIKSTTQQIGVMVSIGVGKKDIISIFLIYTLLMAITSGLLGTGVGIVLSRLLGNVMRKVYSLPMISLNINPLIAVLAFFSLLIFAELATLISCGRIFKITPKDATLNNETKRKPLPKFLNNFIDKAPMNTKLSVNSIAQNFRRFIVSIFSIFASFVIILLALFFFSSKSKLMKQSEERLNFDCQAYFTTVKDDSVAEELKNKPFVNKLEDCYYTYVEVNHNGKKAYLECLAYDINSTNNQVLIPDAKGKNYLKASEEGIILPASTARVLNVKKGDTIKINDVDVKINDISAQYFHPMTYMSKNQLKAFTSTYISSYLIDTNDENQLLEYFEKEMVGSLTVFTKNLSKDIHGIFDSINIFIYIMIFFCLGMGFVILTIMSQNSLMEQKRQISVFRLIGFTVKNVSDLWTLQSISQLILSSIIAIPMGSLFSYILFKMCSNVNQTYPFVFDIKFVVLSFLFILLIIIISHVVSMLSIKKWNLADNTRCRE